MIYQILASDYDNTLAREGKVAPETIAAISRWRATRRKLLIVTGRLLKDLLRVFPEAALYDGIVAENGPLLYYPSQKEEKIISSPPPSEFIKTLQERNVKPLTVGKAIVATKEQHLATVNATIEELGCQLQVILNKGEVMVVPFGVDKGVGLLTMLNKLEVRPEAVVGVGDAENDLGLLRVCGCGVAVANALAELKQVADWVTQGSYGAGVIEVIDRLLEAN